jgi:hypothetical protein
MAKLEAFHPETFYSDEDLVVLDFSNSSIKPADDDLANLEPLDTLESLILIGAPITDAGLVHLKGLKKLRYVILTGDAVTSEGVDELQRALPKLSITYPPGHFPRPSRPAGRR